MSGSDLPSPALLNAEASLPPLSLSFWMAGAENTKLGQAACKWFSLLGRAATWAVDYRDPLTCGEAMLDLLAWERSVTRTLWDSERLYRLRVRYAYENAADAGSVSGWRRIFERLELIARGELTLEERIPGQDWDIVGIVLSDERQGELQQILERIVIEEYGRTCRRYYLVSRVVASLFAGLCPFDDDHTTTLCAGAMTSHRQGVLYL